MEYNPMEELGFVEENQLVLSCDGILSMNDFARDLCARSIRDGGRFFDVVSRYNDLITYSLCREEPKVVPTLKLIIPFLKAFGVTDHSAYEFAKEDLRLVPGAKESVGYLKGLLPTYVSTGSYEHHVMALCDALDFPPDYFSCTKAEFDAAEQDRLESRKIRELASRISSMRIPDTLYTVTDPDYLDDDDSEIVDTLDEIFNDTVAKMEAAEKYKDLVSIGSNEKAYSLLEIRRKTGIEFDATAYVGSGANDYQALDLIRDSEGLAISFNGSEHAVRGCNVAVMASNTIVLDVLVGEFYNEGIQAVFDMVDNWDRSYLETHKCSDRNLMDRMLAAYPKKLPVVKRVGRRNVKRTIEESEAYRKKFRR